MIAIQGVCSEYGIYVALPPESAFEAAGILSGDYYGGESTHTNTKMLRVVMFYRVQFGC